MSVSQLIANFAIVLVVCNLMFLLSDMPNHVYIEAFPFRFVLFRANKRVASTRFVQPKLLPIRHGSGEPRTD